MIISTLTLTGTALVIDDQETILSVVDDMLTAVGMKVLLAQGGSPGIKIFREHFQKIDLVLLDMKMPGMDGDEVFAQLHEIKPDIRVIIASGFGERETMAHFADHKTVAFIQKPYRFQALIEKVAAVLQDKPPL